MYCCTPKALNNHVGSLSSTTTSVQHPLGWCDSCHRTTVPVRSPHTSYRWRRERVIEPIKCLGIIRRPWLTRASGGNFPLYEKCHGISNDHRESGPRFNVLSEIRCFFTVLGPTQTTGWAPPAGLTNTSSSSNLVFTGGLPSRYWPAQPCLASVGCRVIWLPALFI